MARKELRQNDNYEVTISKISYIFSTHFKSKILFLTASGLTRHKRILPIINLHFANKHRTWEVDKYDCGKTQ